MPTGEQGGADVTRRNDDDNHYFWIRDRIVLAYHPVDSEVVHLAHEALHAPPTEAAEQSKHHFAYLAQHHDVISLSHALQSFEQPLCKLLKRVREHLPEVGEGLEVLNRKLNLLANVVAAQQNHRLHQHAARVEISAGGIQFRGRRQFNVGDHLQLEMTLFPGYTMIRSYGRVLRCQQDPKDPACFRTAVEYEAMAEETRDLIVEHLFRKQSDELRERREQREAEADREAARGASSCNDVIESKTEQ